MGSEDDIIKFREQIRKGILSDDLDAFLSQEALKGTGLLSALKIFLYHYHRCHDTDEADNYSIAAAILMKKERGEDKVLVGDFVGTTRLDALAVRSAIMEKSIEVDNNLWRTMEAIMISNEVKRTEDLLGRIAVLEKKIDAYEIMEKQMQDMINERARQLLLLVLGENSIKNAARKLTAGTYGKDSDISEESSAMNNNNNNNNSNNSNNNNNNNKNKSK